MQENLQITFRNFRRRRWIEERVREEAARLDRYHPRILGCRVVLDLSHRRHVTGNHFKVRIGLAVPGEEIVVDNEPDFHASRKSAEVERLTRSIESDPTHKNIAAAIDDAFETARRRLQDVVRRQRGQ